MGLAASATFAQSDETVQTVIETLAASLGPETDALNPDTNPVADPEDRLFKTIEIAAFIDGQRDLNLTLLAGDEEKIAYDY